ncbi:MAG: DUF192 domain-containing protein [Geobacteraceae bacterium]
MRVRNITTNKEVASHVVVADTLFLRLKGLLGRKALTAGEGLLIKPCKGVHTFGMRFPIDVVFLDKQNFVIACKKNMAPNRLTPVYPRAATVLELSAGIIDATSTETGHQLELA